MASIRIKKGFDIKLQGTPSPEVTDAMDAADVAVFPKEYKGIKPRLAVKQGDAVLRGSLLFYDKQNEALKFRAPACGTVKEILLGERRSLERIVIERAKEDTAEAFTKHSANDLSGLAREEILNHLQDTGFIALVKERPFDNMANPANRPKSIFINGMNTAPCAADPGVLVAGEQAAFQAGIDILKRLTDGPVHLCVSEQGAATFTEARNVERHTFSGPHPAGNTSVHIHHLDALAPHDIVWTVKAEDAVLIGKLFLDGEIPASRVIALGGSGVRSEARRYYRVRLGSSLTPLLNDRIEPGDQRVISGTVLSGTTICNDSYLRIYDSTVTVIPEGRERHFMGWMMPGLNRFSLSRTSLSRWLKMGQEWNLNTSVNGSLRALVFTGLYDKFVPMQIMVDYLIRAILAHDTDEAIKLGILETVPEDFALCAFACPSKLDLCGIVRNGLKEIEDEGI